MGFRASVEGLGPCRGPKSCGALLGFVEGKWLVLDETYSGIAKTTVIWNQLLRLLVRAQLNFY